MTSRRVKTGGIIALTTLAAVLCTGCYMMDGMAKNMDRAFNGPRPTLPSPIERRTGKKYAERWVWLRSDGSLQYHHHSCPYLLNGAHNVSLSYTKSMGYYRCGVCSAPG